MTVDALSISYDAPLEYLTLEALLSLRVRCFFDKKVDIAGLN